MHNCNETHDPALQSWVPAANAADCDFPLQNLPYGVFRRAGSTQPFRVGVAIGDQILDLTAAYASGALPEAAACCAERLNPFMAQGSAAWSALRLALSRALRQDSALQERLQNCLLAQDQAEFDLPAQIGDYTDFYTSIHHASAVGRLLRPDNPLLPNYRWIPIGYHGRASSIAVSGHSFHRPVAQRLPAGASAPVLAPSARMDYELELGAFVGSGNALGSPVPVQHAESHLFGLCLLNDWSARDVQGWEYQPLGPFLAKNFATTVSPWIVTLEALAPFREPWSRPESDPQPLPYLDHASVRSQGALAIELEVWLQSAAMRAKGLGPHRLSRSNFRHAYWTLAQMLAHHTVNGCNLRPGDLLGTGTQSGPSPEEAGSLMELAQGGQRALHLPGGEERRFLEDGDTVLLRACAQAPGARRIGFGEARATLLPALAPL